MSATPSSPALRSVSPEAEVEGGGRWREDEDERLRTAVAELGVVNGRDGTWKAISERVGGGRTDKSCKKRWLNSLDPTVRKGRWSADEDAALLSCYQRVGPKWHIIAEHVTGRTADAIAKRYRDTLDPLLDAQAPWTSEEDAILLAAQAQVGPLWTLICSKLPGRSGMMTRNRWRFLTRTSSSASNRAGDSKERPSEAGPSRSQRLSASSASRSRSPGRPRVTREDSASSTGESNSVTSPFDINKYYASIASPAPQPPHPQQQQQQLFPPVFDSPLSPSSIPSPGPFSEAELAFLRQFRPGDEETTSMDWAQIMTASTGVTADAMSLPRITDGFSICSHCHGSGVVPITAAPAITHPSGGLDADASGPPNWSGLTSL